MIVFDLNKTLMSKVKKGEEGRDPDFKVGGMGIQLRPQINAIKLLSECHEKTKQVKIVIWTSMSGHKNAKKFKEKFREAGIPIDDVFEGSIM